MRERFAILALILFATLACWSQADSGTAQTAPAAKPAASAKPVTAAKPPVHQAAGNPTAIIDTTAGKMSCELFPDKAPEGVKNFIGLARGTKDWKNPATGATKHGVPLYDGTIFHRVIPDFMIQGGDPAGTGSGEIGFEFKNEVSPDLLFDKSGRLAYANAGPNTNGSQFFITEVALLGRQGDVLNGHYTIFGQCEDATVELVKQIARMGRDRNDRPYRPVKINHISIVKNSVGAAKPAAAAAPKAPANPN